jgi:hypothetical protein
MIIELSICFGFFVNMHFEFEEPNFNYSIV